VVLELAKKPTNAMKPLLVPEFPPTLPKPLVKNKKMRSKAVQVLLLLYLHFIQKILQPRQMRCGNVSTLTLSLQSNSKKSQLDALS
jgi:hypothetical protein